MNQIRIHGNSAYFGDVWKMEEIPDGSTDTRICIDYIGKFYYINRFHAAPGGSVEYLSLPDAPITVTNNVNSDNAFSIVGLNFNSADEENYSNTVTNEGSTSINTHKAGYISRSANDDFTVVGKNGEIIKIDNIDEGVITFNHPSHWGLVQLIWKS